MSSPSNFPRTLLFALAFIVMLCTAVSAQQKEAILVLYDSKIPLCKAKARELEDKLRATEKAGEFDRIPDFEPFFLFYDFSSSFHQPALSALNAPKTDLPRICLVETVDHSASKILWSAPANDADLAVENVLAQLAEKYGRLPELLTIAIPGPNDLINEKEQSVLVKIPAGTFLMGSDERADERPIHQVILPAYYIGKTEVTNAQFRRFVDETGYDAGETWQEYERMNGRYAAVTHVHIYDAQANCKWAGLRLPTEQEWEKAARGTDGRVYPWGNEFDPERLWYYKNTNQAQPVGLKPTGASPYGCLDMSGNAEEWTSSWYQAYPGGEPDDFYGEKYKVVRGGTWGRGAEKVRCARRRWASPKAGRSSEVGFRVAKSIAGGGK